MSKPRKGSKDKRENPAFQTLGMMPPPFGVLADTAGTLMVTMALNRCTFQEKALIASMIPFLLKIIRTVPKGEQRAAVEKLWPAPEEVDNALRTIERTEATPKRPANKKES